MARLFLVDSLNKEIVQLMLATPMTTTATAATTTTTAAAEEDKVMKFRVGLK